jgi:hypothetical protein
MPSPCSPARNLDGGFTTASVPSHQQHHVEACQVVNLYKAGGVGRFEMREVRVTFLASLRGFEESSDDSDLDLPQSMRPGNQVAFAFDV